MKWWIARHATLGLGASRKALASLFGPVWETDPRWRVFYCSIDLTPFQSLIDSVAVRTELGIPADGFVIGHVGRFYEQKNHLFLVDIAAEIAKREPRMRLLLVGDGTLRPNIEQKVAEMGLTDHVIFAGTRLDVPRLMLGAMDVFLFPSLYEGLGLVLIEAQVAGLPCIFSDVVPAEADVVKPLMRRLFLSQPASAWAEVILATSETGPGITQAEALMLVEQSSFNIRTTIKDLEKLYLECS
jgi:glycosyltransferase involved in cell wall biosynthesis